MRKLVAFILASSLSLNCFATECTSPVRLLEEGTSAQCRGYLFSPDKELEVRMMKQDYAIVKQEKDTLIQMVDRLNKKEADSEAILNLESQKTELWKTRAEDITLKYVSVEENRGRRDFLFILMGIGLTVLAGWTVGQVAPGR